MVARNLANDGNTSVVAAALLLLATGVGTGVLVLPKAMAAVGYVPMIALLIVGSLLSGLTTWLLFLAVAQQRLCGESSGALNAALLQTDPFSVRQISGESCRRSRAESTGSVPDFAGVGVSLDVKEGPSYADLLSMVMPAWTGVVLDLMLVIYGTGAVVTYFLFLSAFVHEFTFWPTELTQNITIVLTACIVFPAACAESVTGLARLGSLGLLSLAFMTVGVWIREPELSASRSHALEAVADLERLPAVGCVCVYAFMWHLNCVGVARDLKNPTRLRCALVAFGGTTLLLLVYLAIGLGGYLSFGSKIFEKSSLVDMYSTDDPVFMVVRLSMVPSLVIASIVNIYPIRESFVGLIRSVQPTYEVTALQRSILALLLVACATVTAIKFPDVVAIITLMGGSLATFMMIVFPTIISRMVLPKRVWIVLLIVNAAISIFLIIAALGLIGKPT